MVYLILAILSSTAISILMRVSEKDIHNNMVMFTANYLVCALLSGVYTSAGSGEAVKYLFHREFAFAAALGLLSGALYLLSFVLLQYNIRRNGVVLAAVFMKLGVLVPVLTAIVVFRERPSLFQAAGFILSVTAVLLIYREKESPAQKEKASAGIWLLVLLIAGGCTDTLANVYDKLGEASFRNLYLLFTFLAAMCLSLLFVRVRGQHFTRRDFLWGILIGIPNYFSARFLLYALGSVKAIVVYPVYNAAVILLISLFGVFLFREKLSRQKQGGLLLVVAAIVCLNI